MRERPDWIYSVPGDNSKDKEDVDWQALAEAVGAVVLGIEAWPAAARERDVDCSICRAAIDRSQIVEWTDWREKRPPR